MGMRNFSLDQLAQRTEALTVACQYCGSAVDVECMKTDYRTGKKSPVENFPAHESRLKRAARARRMRQADAEHHTEENR